MGLKFNPFTNTFDFSGTSWGAITGTLSDQTDLQSALDAKQNILVSGNGTTQQTDRTDWGGALTMDSYLDGGGSYSTFFTNSVFFGVGNSAYDPTGGGNRGFIGFDSATGTGWLGDLRGSSRSTYVYVDDGGSRSVTINALNGSINLFDQNTSSATNGYVWTLTDNSTGRGEWTAIPAAPVLDVNGTANRITVSPTTGNVLVDIAATYVGQTSITTLGTITTGVWNGTLIGVTKGGTGTSTSFTTGSVVFAGASGVYSQNNANFFWDNTNNRLALGSTTTTETLNVLGNSLLLKTGTATVGTQTYNSNEYKLQGSQWFTSGSVAKTLTGGMTIKPRNPGAIVTSTLDFGYAIDSSTERPVISYKVGDHYNDGYAGQLTLRSGYWDGLGSFATGYGSSFGGTMETQYDGTFAFRPVGASGADFSGIRALSFGTHPVYASFWARWGYGGGSSYDADIRVSFNGAVNIGAGQPAWYTPSPGAGATGSELLSITIDGVITGNNASRPALRITKATEQLRVGYDTSNYFKTTINSTGSATLDLVGTSPEFTFSDPVNVPDEAYGSGWDGNTEVPTKNAVYDKVETLVNGWNPASGTWTYASATTFTVPAADVASMAIGDKVKFTQTSVKYFSIVGISGTTITVTGGTDYTVANAAITSPYWSHAASPVGHPDWYNFTPTVTAGTGTFTTVASSARFRIIGRACQFVAVTTTTAVGTAATETRLTLPVTGTGNPAADVTGNGLESYNSGDALVCRLRTTTSLGIRNYVNGFAGGNNSVQNTNIIYEI